MLVCCGLNHKTAPVDLREKVIFSEGDFLNFLKNFVQKTGLSEVVILSTCNRLEIYCEAENHDKILINIITDWLSDYHQINSQDLKPHFYLYQSDETLKHALRVASGLDSMVLGETQIFGQLKNAVNKAEEAGTLGKKLRRFFEHIFSSTKLIRSETRIGEHTLSLGHAAMQLAKTIFEDISKTRVLFIGAGDIVSEAAKYFQTQKIAGCFIANRTLSNSDPIAGLLNAKTISLQQIPSILSGVDIIISGIHHITPLIGKGIVETALKRRKHRAMLMIDLAVPRNIEPEIKSLEDVYLYHIDDLQYLLQENYQRKYKACLLAEPLIEAQILKYHHHLQQINLSPVIQDYRDKMYEIRDEILKNALKQLLTGEMPEAVLEKMAYQLTNKLIHSSSIKLKNLKKLQENG